MMEFIEHRQNTLWHRSVCIVPAIILWFIFSMTNVERVWFEADVSWFFAFSISLDSVYVHDNRMCIRKLSLRHNMGICCDTISLSFAIHGLLFATNIAIELYASVYSWIGMLVGRHRHFAQLKMNIIFVQRRTRAARVYVSRPGSDTSNLFSKWLAIFLFSLLSFVLCVHMFIHFLFFIPCLTCAVVCIVVCCML